MKSNANGNISGVYLEQEEAHQDLKKS